MAVERYKAKHPDKDHLYYVAHRDEIRERRRLKRLEGEAERQKVREQKHQAALERRKIAQRERGRARYASNPNHIKEINRKSANKHPETGLACSQRKRARMRNATIGVIDYKAIIERDKKRCQICGKQIRKVDYSFDHIIPLSLGGAHSQENLQLTHRSCNSSRGAGRLPAQIRF